MGYAEEDAYDEQGNPIPLCALPTEILSNPFNMLKVCWPKIKIYDDQADIIRSVYDGNKITMVHAGNMLGKDFITGFISLWFFCSRSPARVVTSSIDASQLEGVLWGEIRRWIDTSEYPLGLKVNHLHLRQVRADNTIHPLSEMIGRVAQTGVSEGLLGRHVPRGPGGLPTALAVIDEASGFDDIHKDAMETWAHQMLIIGNCYPCTNFFFKGYKSGDIPDPTRKGKYFLKVLNIQAKRSPNIRLALNEIEAGLEPSHREVTPGCMPYSEYVYRRSQWDAKKQTIGLDAKFYEGDDVKLYPPSWLERGIAYFEELEASGIHRTATGMGVDTAEGGDSTVWVLVDAMGMIKLISKKTKDTSVIFQDTIDLIQGYGLDPSNVIFDIGGGGKEHSDYLNRMGWKVRTVAFGSGPTPDKMSPLTKSLPGARHMYDISKLAYKNRRAEMYGLLRDALNPTGYEREERADYGDTIMVKKENQPFAIVPDDNLIKQLSAIPLEYDAEGRMILPPKNRPSENYKGRTLVDLIGNSPDEADALVMARYAQVYPAKRGTSVMF